LICSSSAFFCERCAHPRDLHSFPTRRSSDLGKVRPWRRKVPLLRYRPAWRVTARRHAKPSSWRQRRRLPASARERFRQRGRPCRSEEHTSELQSRENLVCRLLLEKKKEKTMN